MNPKLETINIFTQEDNKYNYVIIWMHGLGADGNDFVPIVNQLNLLKNKNIKFIFPNAPNRPVTINNNMIMRAWFDILSLDRAASQDKKGILESKNLIIDIINDEHINNNIPYENICLAGFSQGGALALYTALTCKFKLNSVIALSCYLPISDDFIINKTDENKNTPILLAHGTHDSMIPIEHANISCQLLNEFNYNVIFKEYRMDHSLCDSEIKDINVYLNKHLQ
tara:strand:+ start:2416 stop:3093 length:678 start_codon:yes stop_codon:yes gene_type:complete